MLSVAFCFIVMLNVIMLNVIVLSVVAPCSGLILVSIALHIYPPQGGPKHSSCFRVFISMVFSH